MRVSGFTFVRNALLYAYPVEQSIRSILPLCDEVVVVVGNSQDETLDLVRGIGSPKLRIVESVWDDSLRQGGRVLAVETDKALDAVAPDSDWCLYVQADEVLHEQYLPALQASMRLHLNDPGVEGLLFDYLHFWGSYDYIGSGRRWYRREVRVVRNDPSVRSYRDAQGFRKQGRKLRVKPCGAVMYHYGWVRPPDKQQDKQRHFHRYWHDDRWIEREVQPRPEFDYGQIDRVERFRGSHPAVMQPLIERIHWEFTPPRPRPSLKNRLLHCIERLTGWRPGEYRNYKIV